MSNFQDLPGASALVVPGSMVQYRGFSLRETSGVTAAVVRFRVASASGAILDTVRLAANESVGVLYDAKDPLEARDGIYFELVSGTVEGSVRHS